RRSCGEEAVRPSSAAWPLATTPEPVRYTAASRAPSRSRRTAALSPRACRGARWARAEASPVATLRLRAKRRSGRPRTIRGPVKEVVSRSYPKDDTELVAATLHDAIVILQFRNSSPIPRTFDHLAEAKRYT